MGLMNRGIIAGWAILAAGAGAIAQELNREIESLIGSSRLTGAVVGVCIQDLDGGRTLADIRADRPFIPASNLKLLTSGTALAVLGPDFTFRTELILDGSRLVIRGGGDPALADPAILERMPEKMTVSALLSALAGAVKRAGADRITEIVVDDRIFDRQYIHPTWPKDQLDKWYCAEVAGVNFHTNVISAFPKPSPEGIGRPPIVDLEPAAPWLEIENKARTVAAGKNSVWLSRDPEMNRLTVFGEVRLPTRVAIDLTIHDVPTFAGQLIAAELPKAGVGVGAVEPLGDHRTWVTRDEIIEATGAVRLAAPDEVLGGRPVAAVTTALADVLVRCNSDSQNLYAEAMLKRLGHDVTKEPGSWTNGSSVVRMTVAERLGPDAAASTVIADGSGLSRENRVSPRTLTRWLDQMQRDPERGPMYIASLATPEHRESLRYRFRDARLACNLHAKTGTINGVRCLSGYLIDPVTSRKLAFSIMVNDLKEGEQALTALKFHQQVVSVADRWLASQRPARPPTETASTKKSRGKKGG